jgi:hypothetical protein
MIDPKGKLDIISDLANSPNNEHLNRYEALASDQPRNQFKLWTIVHIGVPCLAGIVSTLGLLYAFLGLYMNYAEYERRKASGLTPEHLYVLSLLIIGSVVGLAYSAIKWRSRQYTQSSVAFFLALVGLILGPWIYAMLDSSIGMRRL